MPRVTSSEGGVTGVGTHVLVGGARMVGEAVVVVGGSKMVVVGSSSGGIMVVAGTRVGIPIMGGCDVVAGAGCAGTSTARRTL